MLIQKPWALNRKPTYQFRIGELVQFGSHENARIVEVYDNLMSYKVHTIDVRKRRGQRIVEEGDFIVPWQDIRPMSVGKTNFAALNPGIRLNTQSRTLESLMHSFYAFGIDMSPTYQRGLCWTDSEKQRLLESIFMGADIGRFVLNEKNYDDVNAPIYEIVDGKQRLNVILDFYENRIPFKGVHYNDLSETDRRAFGTHSCIIAVLTNADEITVRKVFLLMNRGGRAMDEAHLRKVEAEVACMEAKKKDGTVNSLS